MRGYWLAVAALAVLIAGSPSLGETFRFDSIRRGQREISLTAGYGENHRIPAATKDRFAFDILELRYGRFVSPRNEVTLELAAGRQNSEQPNAAVWSTVGFRHYLLVRGSTALSCDLSAGIIRLNNRVSSQGTKTNFTEQLGIIWQVATGPKSAVGLQYRFFHISNAGINLPNLGINVSTVSLCYSHYL